MNYSDSELINDLMEVRFMRCINCGAEFEGYICPVCGYTNNGLSAASNQNEVGFGQEPIQGNLNGYGNGYTMNDANQQGNQGYAPAQKQKKPVNKKALAIIVSIFLALVIVVVTLIIILNKPKTVKLNSYVKLETLDGYNGYGKVTYTIDKDKFVKDYSGIEYTDEYVDELRKQYGNYTNTYLEIYPANKTLANYLSGCFDKDKKLSDGDIVHYEWNIDKAELEKMFDIKLEYGDIEYTVSGLEEAETFNPFEGIEVEFSGIDPNGMAKYVIVENNRYNTDLTYEFDKKTELKNGDVIKLSILGSKSEDELFEYCIDSFGKLPEVYEKSYVVAVDQYINSGEMISQDIIDEMTELTNDHMDAHASDYFSKTEKYLGITYIGYYFLKAKFDDSPNNSLYLLYRVRAANEAVYDDYFEYYFYINYDDIRVNTDGQIEYDKSEYTFPKASYDSFWDEHEGTYLLTDGYWYAGYAKLEDFVNDKIVSCKELYTYEEKINDLAPDSLIENCTYVSSLVGKEMTFEGHRYMIVEKKTDWDEAKTRCESNGGHLVTITSEEEQKFVERLLGRKNAWIGAYKDEDEWKWVTQEKMDYVKWSNKEGRYATMEADHYWSCDGGSLNYYICEWDQ